jgi:hypothetical protein
MKRTPTSWRDMVNTVLRVRHLELEDSHKIWLVGLAVNASQNGKNAYPGYKALGEITGRQSEWQRRTSRHCESLGLVEIVRKANGGNGKGNANVYRICLEHDAFPDDYSGRKTPPDGEGLSDTKTPPVVEGFSTGKTPPVPAQNPSNLEAKALQVAGKTPPHMEDLSVPPSESLTTPTPHPNPEKCGVVCEEKPPTMEKPDAAKSVRKLLAMQPLGWMATRDDVKALTFLVNQMGEELFLAAGKQYILKPPARVDERTKCPWMFFRDNVNTYVLEARKAAATKAKEDATRPTIEQELALIDRRSKVHVTSADREEFLASLPQEDRDYIAAVDAATKLAECPADNGKDYEKLRYEFMCARLKANADADLFAEETK